MAKIQKLKVLSFAQLGALIGALFGLVAGIVYSFGGLAIDIAVTIGVMVSTETPGISYGTVLAFGALIGMPLIGLLLGLIIGFISAVLYNLFAKYTGGIDVDLTE